MTDKVCHQTCYNKGIFGYSPSFIKDMLYCEVCIYRFKLGRKICPCCGESLILLEKAGSHW